MTNSFRNLFPLFSTSIVLLFIVGCSGSKESTKKDHPYSPDYSELSPVRKKIIIESRKWLGVKYRYNGTDRKGVDCSGFVGNVFSANGIQLPRTSTEIFTVGKFVSKKDLMPADLVFFKNTAGYGITHVGIYLGNFWFIHASTSKGVIESRLNDDYYQRHYAGARRIIE
jgi:probable lipoprotein NlpC